MAAVHPEVQAEIDRILNTLSNLKPGAEPAPRLRDQVLGFLHPFLSGQQAIDLADPPLLDEHSDARAWQAAIRHLRPASLESGLCLQVISSTETHELCVVWLSGTLTEEPHPHEEFAESFLLLEGCCACDFEGVQAAYCAGDFFRIPPNTRHVVRNTSTDLPYVKGLVQRLRVAA
ncbi:MAG TPA: cupin domain-containing protein [Saprospiraceae bacterium]|nr:cupin domain-containing protein [Saprospiraceae bacterium]HND89078.1 cupin domain-containing protein [Saprospiraceae bacterium]